MRQFYQFVVIYFLLWKVKTTTVHYKNVTIFWEKGNGPLGMG